MKITNQTAVRLLVVLLVLLLVGTQMPGAWRDWVFRIAHLPWQLTKVAHFVLFAGMAYLARVPPMSRPVRWIFLAALGLALLTEGLQFFAIARDPSWYDVGIDMAGAATGLLFSRVGRAGRPD